MCDVLCDALSDVLCDVCCVMCWYLESQYAHETSIQHGHTAHMHMVNIK